ncbi:MAG: IS110 family transposase [Cyclobacteriaceae bacterium]
MQTKVNENTFSGQSIYVGVDVHLKSWKVTVMAGDIHYKTFSAPPESEKLVNYLKTNFPGAEYYSAYEAGFCGFAVHRELTRMGINSIIVNPADIPTTDKERRQKEDQRDSRKIASTLQSGKLRGIFIPSEKTQQDRILLRTRDTIVKDLKRNKTRVKMLLFFQGITLPARFGIKSAHWSKQFIQWVSNIAFEHNTCRNGLDALLDMVNHQRSLLLKVTRQIRELSKTPEYRENVELLLTVPGIGILTAMRLLTELESINRFTDFDQLCSYVGLVPCTDSSGDNQIVLGISPRKHSRLRVALIESSWIAIRNDPALFSSYQKLCKRMAANKAIIRIAKKLLRRINLILRRKEKYEIGIIK